MTTAWAGVVLSVGGRQDTETAAGWTALVVMLLLGAAVAFLGWSLTKQLRRAQRAKDAGVYGDEPTDPTGRPGLENGPDDDGGPPARS